MATVKALKPAAVPPGASQKKSTKPSRSATSAAQIAAAKQLARQMVAAAVVACEDKKAEDIRILELDPQDAGFTDFFLIASGTNERQVQAIADEIEMKMKRDFGTYANSVEGRRQSEWILLDYVDFVVHVFVAEKRAFYDIERLRKSATNVDLEQLKAALTEKTTAARDKSPAKKVPGRKAAAVTAEAKQPAEKTAVKRVGVKKTTPKKTAAKKAVPLKKTKPSAKA